MRDCLDKPALSCPGNAEIVVRLQAVVVDFQGFPVVGHRFVEASDARQGRAEGDVSIDVVGVCSQRHLEMLDRRVNLAVCCQVPGEVVVGDEVVRIALQRVDPQGRSVAQNVA